MRGVAAALLLLLGCGKSDVPARPAGLSPEDERRRDALVAATDDAAFDDQLGALYKSGQASSILVLTEALLRLPWEKDLAPKNRYDLRMRLMRVSWTLDKLLLSGDHDLLRYAYMNARAGEGGDPAKAAAELRAWTLDRLPKFVWHPEDNEFSLPENAATR